MDKCFAYEEDTINGFKYIGCAILKEHEFRKVQRKGGCRMENCPFFKETRDQIRSDWGLYPMSKWQKEDQAMFFDRNYKGLYNVKIYK